MIDVCAAARPVAAQTARCENNRVEFLFLAITDVRAK
jgi:hypothetical protein